MNPIKGEVPLTLSDGRELTLVADFEALIEAEQAYGKKLEMLLADLDLGFSGAARAVLYGLLRRCHPNLTREDAARLMFEEREVVFPAIESAFATGFPKKVEGKEGAHPPLAGKPSGSSGAKRASNPKGSGAKRRARSS